MSWSFLSNSGCSPYVVENLSDKSCQQDYKKAMALFEKQNDYKVMVITSANRIFSYNKEKIIHDKNMQELKIKFSKLAQLGKKVILFGPRPEISENVMGCIKKRPDFIQRYIDNSSFCQMDRTIWETKSLEYKNFLKDLASVSGNIFIDPEKLICKTDKCSIVNDNKTTYIDREYLSNYGSLKMAEFARDTLRAYQVIF